MTRRHSERRHYTITEAAEVLGVSRRTVHRRVVAGVIPAEQISDAATAPYLIPADKLEEAAR